MVRKCKVSEPGTQGFSLGEWRWSITTHLQRSCQGGPPAGWLSAFNSYSSMGRGTQSGLVAQRSLCLRIQINGVGSRC